MGGFNLERRKFDTSHSGYVTGGKIKTGTGKTLGGLTGNRNGERCGLYDAHARLHGKAPNDEQLAEALAQNEETLETTNKKNK